jgi:cytoskeletal protein CcmA (bactofilin family)
MDELSEDKNKNEELESLESNPETTSTTSGSENSLDGGPVRSEPIGQPTPTVASKKPGLKHRLTHVNIYLTVFCLLIVGTAALGGFLYLNSKQAKQSADTLSSQSLSSSSLSELANSGVSVGDPKQVLTVQSNSIFSGKVLVRQDLEVAGRLLVGSSLSLTGITVSGQSKFDDVQVTKDLAVTGNAAIQGKLSLRNLAVTGDGNFGGTVTASQLVANNLTLNGNVTLTHHLIAGGATPSRSNGGALGSGGTSTVSGSDTAGSITVNSGGSPSAGCFITVNFTQKYNSVPRIIITPVGAAAANVGYYVSRTTSSFSVCGTSPAPAGQNFGFDYMVIE